MLNKIKIFYETLFKNQSSKNISEIEKCLCAITNLSFNNDQINPYKKTFLKLVCTVQREICKIINLPETMG